MRAHTHSSLAEPLPKALVDFLPSGCDSRSMADLCVTLIWKNGKNTLLSQASRSNVNVVFEYEVGRDPECIESALSSGVIRGEANMLRFFCRSFNLLGYEKTSNETIKVDIQVWLSK